MAYRSNIIVLVVITVVAPIFSQISPEPSDTTGELGHDAMLICGHIGTNMFEWVEYVTNPLGNSIFKAPPGGQPENSVKFGINGSYNLIVKDLSLSDGGTYGCRDYSMAEHVKADLVVLDPPEIVLPLDLPAGILAQVSCYAQYGGPEEPANIPNMRVYVDGQVLNQPPNHTPGKPGPEGENIPGQLSVSFNYTPSIEHNGRNLTCEIYTDNPAYSLMVSVTLDVVYPVQNLQIHPIKSTYYVNEYINCTAEGNPDPEFKWRPITSPGSIIISDSVLPINANMEGENEWKCQATNDVMNLEFEEEIISFTVVGSEAPGTGKASRLSVDIWMPVVMLVYVTLM